MENNNIDNFSYRTSKITCNKKLNSYLSYWYIFERQLDSFFILSNIVCNLFWIWWKKFKVMFYIIFKVFDSKTVFMFCFADQHYAGTEIRLQIREEKAHGNNLESDVIQMVKVIPTTLLSKLFSTRENE